MTIQFDTIPDGIRKPGNYFEYNNKLALSGLPANTQKLCIIGQKTSSGSVAALLPTKIFSEADAILYSGMGSMVHRMVKSAFFANPNIDVTIVNLDDAGSSAAAAGTVTFTGPATGSGVLQYQCGADMVQMAIPSGLTANQAATAFAALLTAHPDLPVSAAVDGETLNEVDVTAKNKGTIGNQILHSAVITAPGMTVAVVALTAGATDPDLDTALAVVFPVKYDKIVSPYNNLTNPTTAATYSGSAVAKLKAHMQTVSGALEQRRGFGVIAQTASIALATTLTTNINNERVSLGYARGVKMWSPEVAAHYAAAWMGQPDPAMPLNGMELRGIDVAPQGSWLSRQEQETLLANGVTPLDVDGGGTMRIIRAVTCYLTNSSNTPDPSYLDVTTITALDYGDLAIRTRINLRFRPAKGTERTIRDVRSEIIAVMYDLQAAGIWRNVDKYKDQVLLEESNTTPGTWKVQIPAPVVPGLHVLAGQLVLHLS
jgi:phage tail sheath gpL-like